MQILNGKYASVHVRVDGASRKIGPISAYNLRLISFPSTPRRIYWCYFEAIGSIQNVTVTMSTLLRLDDRMKWRIVGRLESGQCQVQICREFILTPSFVCNLWKQFQDTRSIERKPGQGRPRATTARKDHHLSIIPRRNMCEGLQLLGSLTTCMQPQELFQEDFMTEGCLPEDLLFASLSHLRT
ncbi:uncharacterized protein TNCV_2886171 [Trichonephila clavipes]|nr:uncharacterized protein TNCV_2886171 [Trichonephila clavipes]